MASKPLSEARRLIAQRGERIQATIVRLAATFLAILVLGGCAVPDTESFRAPDIASLVTPRSVTNYKEKVLPPVATADLVDANGGCAGSTVPVAGDGQAGVPLPEAGVPMIPAAIGLEMTECDVVKRAGFAERVEIGTGERGERTVTLTYINGQRPGIYHFGDGRLKSMDRAPEPPAPPKVAKQKPAKKTAKPRQQTAIQ